MPSPRRLTTTRYFDVVGSSRATDARRSARPAPVPAASSWRLRKHAEYQQVYAASRKQFGKQMSYFFRLRRPADSQAEARLAADPGIARVGLTVGKVMGKAVDRNRIKRRMREAVRRHILLLRSPVDVVLHPRRSVIDLDFATLEHDVAAVFRAIQRASEQQAASLPPAGN